MPPDQPLFGPDYQGIITVNLWQFGSWVKVHIDDRLPMLKDRLLFSKSLDPNEFWVSLLEKAYAKWVIPNWSYGVNKLMLWYLVFRLRRSYSRLIGGHAVDALVDLTGGLAEVQLLPQNTLDQGELFEKLLNATAWGGFITCRRPVECLPTWQEDQHVLLWDWYLVVVVKGQICIKRRNEWERACGRSCLHCNRDGSVDSPWQESPCGQSEEPLGRSWVEWSVEWQVRQGTERAPVQWLILINVVTGKLGSSC